MNINKEIYVAGPMRGYAHWNFPAFDKNAEFLRSMGWDPISPADLDRQMGFDEKDDSVEFTEADFHEAMLRDYEAIIRCSAIAFMPGWEKSTGANLERSFGTRLKLDFYRIDADTNYFEKELVLGIAGVARAGKDTLANEFAQNAGFERRGFADSLKGMLYGVNPILPAPNWAEVGDNFGKDGVVRVQDYVDAFGWEQAKSITEVRQLLQRLGTEGGREYLGEEIWVDTLFKKPHAARLVISDCRFENEARGIRARGGFVIQVKRPGVEAVNSHASDNIDFECDFTVLNDRTPKEMYLDVVRFLSTRGLEL